MGKLYDISDDIELLQAACEAWMQRYSDGSENLIRDTARLGGQIKSLTSSLTDAVDENPVDGYDMMAEHGLTQRDFI